MSAFKYLTYTHNTYNAHTHIKLNSFNYCLYIIYDFTYYLHYSQNTLYTDNSLTHPKFNSFHTYHLSRLTSLPYTIIIYRPLKPITRFRYIMPYQFTPILKSLQYIINIW